jgi:hypothetical protein
MPAATPVLWNRWFLTHRAAVSLLRVAAFGRSAGDGGARRGRSRRDGWRRSFYRTAFEITCHRNCAHSPLAHAPDHHRCGDKEQCNSGNSHCPLADLSEPSPDKHFRAARRTVHQSRAILLRELGKRGPVSKKNPAVASEDEQQRRGHVRTGTPKGNKATRRSELRGARGR